VASEIEQLPDLTGLLKVASRPEWRHVRVSFGGLSEGGWPDSSEVMRSLENRSTNQIRRKEDNPQKYAGHDPWRRSNPRIRLFLCGELGQRTCVAMDPNARGNNHNQYDKSCHCSASLHAVTRSGSIDLFATLGVERLPLQRFYFAAEVARA